MNTPTDSEAVAAAVCRVMAEKGMSQVDLSKATYIPRATLIRRLHGRSPFTVTELITIAEALGVSASYFMETAA